MFEYIILVKLLHSKKLRLVNNRCMLISFVIVQETQFIIVCNL